MTCGGAIFSRAAIAEFVRSYGADEPVTGLSGALSCRGNGDCALGIIGFFEVQDGAYTQLDFMVDTAATDETDMMATEEMAATDEMMATEEMMMTEEMATEEAGG